MLRDLRQSSYAPTIAIRPAEMRALEELPESDKSAILPMVLLAPWVGSLALDRSMDRLKAAYGDRFFFLDIDRDYVSSNAGNSAQQQFLALRSGEAALSNWRGFVERHEQAIPVIQTRSVPLAEILGQIDWAERLGRGFAFRFDDPSSGISEAALSAISQVGHAEFGVFLDSRWAADSSIHQLWLRSNAEVVVRQAPGAPIVVASTNFPREFSQVEGLVQKTIQSRRVFATLRQALNQPVLVYGDWGSTKPRSYDRSGPPLPRIDYATRSDWVIARSKDQTWSYATAAQRLVKSDFWRKEVSVWGSNMIERTALGDSFAITSPAKAVAARVNLHLHLQANYARPDGVIDTDDPWVD